MRILIDDRWRVEATSSIELPMGIGAAWGQMRDLPSFLTVDPLHARVRMEQRRVYRCERAVASPLGLRLVIEHRMLGIGPDRVGRVLRWREGEGYVVSDLSKRGIRVGFPHICAFQLTPMGHDACNLRITARGKWTATRWPRWAIRLWLWWVLAGTELCVRRHMALYRRRLEGCRRP
jgi:hypothetical protein